MTITTDDAYVPYVPSSYVLGTGSVAVNTVSGHGNLPITNLPRKSVDNWSLCLSPVDPQCLLTDPICSSTFRNRLTALKTGAEQIPFID